MLKKIVIQIEDTAEQAALEEQVRLLEQAGLKVEFVQMVTVGVKPENGEHAVTCAPQQETRATLYVTDNPDKVRAAYGPNCPILLYITEANQDKWWKNVPYAVISVRGLTPDFLERVYRRFVGAPWDILETERLLIREMTEADLDDLYRIHDQPGAEEFVAPLDEDREKQLDILKNYIRKIYPVFGFGMWMVVEKKSGRCIGRVGLQMESSISREQENDGRAEIQGDGEADTFCPELGFIMEKSAQRKGYCLEACRAVLRYGFKDLDLEKICAVVAQENLASREFCARLGGKVEVKGGQYLFYWSRIDAVNE